jgi:hypothetical protein
MLTSARLTKGLFIVLFALTTSALASAQATAQSAKKGTTAPAAKGASATVAEPLKDPSEIKLAVIAEVSSITRSPTWDGSLTGTITTFTVGGKAIELETNEIVHDDGKTWIATKKYGKIRVAGAYGPYVEHTNLGSSSTNYIPPNTTTVGYANGLCIWLTPSQKADLKKLL